MSVARLAKLPFILASAIGFYIAQTPPNNAPKDSRIDIRGDPFEIVLSNQWEPLLSKVCTPPPSHGTDHNCSLIGNRMWWSTCRSYYHLHYQQQQLTTRPLQNPPHLVAHSRNRTHPPRYLHSARMLPCSWISLHLCSRCP
jgi:hypothetical protein